MNDRKPSKWGKVGKVSFIIVLVLLCIVGGAYSFTDIPSASRAYERNLQAAKDAGVAMSSEDADRIRTVNEEDNAASLVLQAEKNFAELDKQFQNERQKEMSRMFEENNYRTPKYYTNDARLVRTWKALEPDFKLLEQASRRKTLVFQYDLRDPYASDISDRGRFKHWIAIIVQKAHLSEQVGDIVEARRMICTAARLATLIQEDAIFDSILKRISASIIVQDELAKWLRSHGTSQAWRAVIRDAATALDNPFDLRPTFRIHHWASQFTTEKLVGWRKGPGPPDSQLDDAGPSYGSTENNVQLLRLVPRFGQANVSRVHEYYAKALKSYPEDLWDLSALHQHMAPLTTSMEGNALSIQVAQFAIPGFYDFDKSMARCAARTNVILQSLAILENGHPKGVLPLSGHHSKDIDGKPIRIRKLPGGWIVYSIGRNGVDDGGDDDAKSPKDFVVRLPK